MPITPHAELTPAMRKERVRQVCNIIATRVEQAGAIAPGGGCELEITDNGRRIMAETLMAWLEDEGL